MKKGFNTFSGLIPLIFCSFMFVQNLYAQCPPPEIDQLFEKKESFGEIMLYAVSETQQSYIDHTKYIYNRLLVRDDKGEGKIRQAIAKAKPTIIMMEDGDDLEEFSKNYRKLLKNCPIQEFLLEEIVTLGTEAEKLGMRDASIEEMLNLIYFYGIRDVYPSWTKRLKKAMSRAISAGIFDPYKLDPGQEKQYWDVSYLGVGIEVYYNVWVKEESVKEGGYAFTSRDALKEGDPELFQLIEEIFPQTLYQ